MKPRNCNRLMGRVLVITLSLAGFAAAADQTYQDTSTLSTWNTTDANWDAGATWINGSNAIFGGVGKAVTVGTVTANGITFNVAGYSLIEGTIALGASPTVIIANANATLSSALATTAGITKAGTGTLTFNNQKTYTGNTTISNGILDLSGGGGGSGVIRGAATVNTGGTLRLSIQDATGYNIGAASLTTINLLGGTLNLNTTANQTLGGAVINLTGGAITGIAGANLDFFRGTSAVNSLVSTVTSTISGTQLKIRQAGGLTFTVEPGSTANGIDLDVSSVIASEAGFPAQPFIKTGAGTMRASGASTLTAPVNVTKGKLIVSGNMRAASGFNVSPGATLEFGATNIFTTGHGVAVDNARVITVTGGTLLMNTAFDARFGNVTLADGATWTSNRTLIAYDALLANTSTGAATVKVTGTAASTMNGSGGIHLQGPQNFDVAEVTGNANADLTVTMRLDNAGTLAGAAGGVVKTGAGTLLLNGQGSYTGGTTVNAGTFVIDGNQQINRLSNNHAVTLNNPGSVFEVRGVNALPNHANSVDVTANAGTVLRIVSGGSAAIGAGGTSHGHLRNVNLAGAGIDLTYSGGGTAYNNESFQLNGDITVSGTAASVIQSSGTADTTGIALNGNRTFTVNDITTGTDLLVSAELENTATTPENDGLTKAGAGTLELTAPNSYSGPTAVNAGTLLLNGAATLPTSAVTVASGALFDFSGLTAGSFTLGAGSSLTAGRTSGFAADLIGNLTLAGTLVPGGPGATAGTLSITGNATLDGATAKFDLANVTTTGTGVNDHLAIIGDLTLANVTEIQVNKLNGSLASGNYTLMTCTGTLTGDVANLSLTGASAGTTRQDFALATDTQNVRLVVSGNPANLVWQGNNATKPTVWDVVTTTNWSGSPDQRFYDGDLVRFDDSAKSFTVDPQGTVAPGTLTVENVAQPYLFTGFGSIVGVTGLTKLGTGLLTIDSTNDFTGPVTIEAGTISIATPAFSGIPGALGVGPLITLGAATTAGTLQYTGPTDFATRPLAVAAGGGRLEVSTADTILTQSAAITLGGALTAAGPGGLTLTGTAAGAGSLVVASGTVLLSAAQTYAGGTVVNGGLLIADGNASFNRLPKASTITINNTGVFEVRGLNALPYNADLISAVVNPGGVLRVVSGASAATGVTLGSHVHFGAISLNGGTIDLTYSGTGTVYSEESFQLDGDVTVTGTTLSTIQTGTTNAFSGIALNATRTFTVADTVAGTDLLVGAELEGGTLVKAGPGTMELTNDNTYTGNTTVNAGSLKVTGKLYKVGYTNTPVVQVNGGTLDLTRWGYDTAGSLGELSHANARVLLNGGTIAISGPSDVTGRGFLVNPAGGSFLMTIPGATLELASDGESLNLPVGGALTLGGDGNLKVGKPLVNNGTNIGSITKTGAGTLSLTAPNTYSGNTVVAAGTLLLTDSAGLRFVIDNTSNTTLTGNGSVTLNGSFTIDTSAVTVTSGAWQLENVTSQTGPYGATFTVAGFTDAGNNQWTKLDGARLWTFDETTGTLSLQQGYAGWISGFGLAAADQDANDDPDGDGIPNAAEMVLGGNPASAMDAALAPTLELVATDLGTGAADYLLFSFRRTDLSVSAGINAQAEYSTNLSAWTPAISGTGGVVIRVDDDWYAPASPATDRVRVYVPRGTNRTLFGRLNTIVP